MLPRLHVSWRGTLPEINVAPLNWNATTTMRLARAISAYDCFDPHIGPWVETADLDVLQLDYQWPSSTPADQRPWNAYASGFLDQLPKIHKSLYLDPQLHLITNAGGGDTLACVEAVAEFLCEHGSGDLPISAIRGDNVLASLEELMGEGIALQDAATGLSVRQLNQPLLTAQIELGAGPLKTALDEGTRIVIAGCYDVAAPIIAAAMSATSLTWERTDTLAQLASLARWQKFVVEYDREDNLALYSQPDVPAGEIAAQLQRDDSISSDRWIHHADVSYRASECDVVQAADGARHPGRIRGEAPVGDWKLNAKYLAAYFAEAVWNIENITEKDSALLMSNSLRAALGYGHEDTSLEINVLEPVADRSLDHTLGRPAPFLIRLRYRHTDRTRCTEFVIAVKNYIAQHASRTDMTLVSLPSVQLATAPLCCPVPRDAVTVAVDTRPAKEWR